MTDPVRTQIIVEVANRLGDKTWLGPVVYDPDDPAEATGVIDEDESNEQQPARNKLTMSFSVNSIVLIDDKDGKIIDESTWEARFVSERGRASTLSGIELRSYIATIKANERLSENIKLVLTAPNNLGGLVHSIQYTDGTIAYTKQGSGFVACVAVFDVIYATDRRNPDNQR